MLQLHRMGRNTMNSLQTLKLTQFNTNQKKSAQDVSRAISQLNVGMSEAIQHQVYSRKNPDGVVDADMLAAMGSTIEALMAQYSEVVAKRDDLLAVKAGTMTIDELHTKYPFDLTEYSNALI